jgi:hypothetical protein
LESYHPYLLPQEVSKTPTTLGTYGSLPKIRKGRFGSLRPLGVNGFKNGNVFGRHSIWVPILWLSLLEIFKKGLYFGKDLERHTLM